MQDLQKRIEALEVGTKFDVQKAVTQQAQMDMLIKLREIRTALVSSDGASNTASSQEIEALKAENEALNRKTAKQAYRIQHLVEVVEELPAKQKL